MVAAEDAFVVGEDAFLERDGVIGSSGSPVGGGEVAAAGEGVEVVRPVGTFQNGDDEAPVLDAGGVQTCVQEAVANPVEELVRAGGQIPQQVTGLCDQGIGVGSQDRGEVAERVVLVGPQADQAFGDRVLVGLAVVGSAENGAGGERVEADFAVRGFGECDEVVVVQNGECVQCVVIRDGRAANAAEVVEHRRGGPQLAWMAGRVE